MAATSIEAALAVAVEKEEQARSFYARWAAEVADPGAAALLMELSAEESRHKERLERAAPLARQAPGRTTAIAPLDTTPADSLVERDPGPEATTQDVLITAIKREVRARALYVQMAQWVGDPDLRALLSALANDEAGHRARLERIYDTIVLTDN
jgi:rubrerythrin